MRHIASIITATMEAGAPLWLGTTPAWGAAGGPPSLQANIRLWAAQGGGRGLQHIFIRLMGEFRWGR